ncbi:MAG: hypothetical protein JWM87_2879 [Candidatus Eremiobacteraeota bacterium]|nr:hypothetical protein [Candidatus Eremiobacteraeota bacterium]
MTVLAASMWCADAAEPDPAVLAVHVRSTSGEPVAARIFIVGTAKNESLQSLSDRNGDARFVVPDGRYWVRAEAPGFQRVREAINIERGTTRDVSIELAPLQEIGRSQSRIVSSVRSSSPDSIARKISPNLADALNSVAGVAAIGTDTGLGLRVALGGEDESLTQFSFGGAPLPASAAALAINTDLVQTVQIDQSREAVQFVGLAPTARPVWGGRLRSGSYGSALNSASFQDTFGSVGVAMLHTLRAAESPLNGTVYLDSSGASYRHVGALHTTGDYLKLTGPVGSWAGSGLVTSSHVLASPIATYFAGAVPFGTGPGERTETTARNPVFALNGAVASTSLAVTYAEFVNLSHDWQVPRLAPGAAFPFDLRERSTVRTYSASAERGLNSDLILDGGWQFFNESTAGNVSGTAERVDRHVDEMTLGLRRADRETGTWRAEYKGGRVDGRPYGEIVASARRRIGRRLSLDVTTSAGTIAQQGSDVRTVRGWLEPYAVAVDCADGTIVAEGPGEAAATPRRFRIFGSAGWTGPGVHLGASAWYTRMQNQLLTGALVPLRANDPSVPVGYIDALVAAAGSSLNCGPGRNYTVFARRDVGGVASTNTGFTLTASLDRGRDHAEAALEIVSARLDAMNTALRDPLSLYTVGGQLPGVPRIRGTVSYDRTLGTRSEMLASIHYEGSNNRYNLPPFVTTSVGVSRVLRPSLSLTFVAGNLFNDYAGSFVSPRYALPVRTAGGSTRRGVAAPLPPLRISAQLDIRLAR